jgi:cyanophycinase
MPSFKIQSVVRQSIALLLCGVFAASCQRHRIREEAEAPGGHLVIVGGGLKRENDQVYSRIIGSAPVGAKAGILPTASGVPEESGPDNAQDFINRSVETEVINVTMNNPEAAADLAVADAIRGKGIIFFTGGVQSRIIEAFRPETGDTAGYGALREVLDKDGVIAGSSAGAAMMSDPCIYWGSSADALIVGHSDAEDRGVKIGKGMGFFPYGMTGQHFLSRGRMGRLIAALELADLKRGYGIDDNKAIAVDLGTDTIEVLGEHGVLLIDLSDNRREGFERRGIRLSLLSDGDTVNGKTGEVRARGVPTNALVEMGEIKAPTAGMWERYAVRDAMLALGIEKDRELVLEDDNFSFHFIRDDKTRIHQGKHVSIVDVKLDIVPKPGIEAAHEALQKELAEIIAEQNRKE